jgi:hypothetical protein
MATCTAVFNTFPDGPVSNASAANDRGCRQYHGQAAVAIDDTHCPHSGPSGGGVCGGATSSRSSWAILSGISACTANFSYLNVSVKAAFGAWNASDLLAIVPLGTGIGSFSTTSNTGSDDDLCRIYHLTVATQDPNTHCDHGNVVSLPCGNAVQTACRMIQAACTTYTDVSTCVTAVGGFVGNPVNMTLLGKSGLAATNNNDLACRLYQAGLALIQKNAGQTAMVTTICKGVPIVGSTQCTGMMPTKAPTSSASTVAVSVASVFALALAF